MCFFVVACFSSEKEFYSGLELLGRDLLGFWSIFLAISQPVGHQLPSLQSMGNFVMIQLRMEWKSFGGSNKYPLVMSR